MQMYLEHVEIGLCLFSDLLRIAENRTIALRLCLALSNSTFQTAVFSTMGRNVG